MNKTTLRNAKQNAINNMCLLNLARFDDELRVHGHIAQNNNNRFGNVAWHYKAKYSKRLKTCSAWVYETDRYIALCSYDTIVAFIDRVSGNLYDILRYVYGYTSTSNQHIRKFADEYRHNKVYQYKAI